MTQQVQLANAPPSSSSEPESIDVRRFPYLVEGARASGAADKRALAFEINNLLIAMREHGHEDTEARVLLTALDGHHLDGLVDKDGRACRKEAVETLLNCGFPHALEVSHEDLVFARTWVPLAASIETPWAEQLKRTRRNGAWLVVGGELLAMVIGAAMGARSPVMLVAMIAGLIACGAAVLFAKSPAVVEGQSSWGALLVVCAIAQLVTAFSLGPAAVIGGVGIIAGLLTALSGQAQPLEDPPSGGRR